jgi:hypothetical protein
MQCRLCRKKIGTMRSLLDREYCSREHRRVGVPTSARLLRELEYHFGGNDLDPTDPIVKRRGRSAAKPKMGGLLLPVLIGFVAVFWFRASDAIPRAPSVGRDVFSGLGEVFAGNATARENFQDGLSAWRGSGGRDWTYHAGHVKPRHLKLWGPTLKLRDYDLHFRAAIEERAIGWVFRASDDRNYYATKLKISRPAPFPLSEIVRYKVVDGLESGRIELPLPQQVQRGTLYNVSVRIQGDRFTTFVNGSQVDSWRDGALKTGGVGFFADAGEVASLLSVEVREKRSLLDRMFAGVFLPGL